MKKTRLLLASLIIIPMTILDVSAAGNSTEELKSTVIDKTLEVFEDGFNSLYF